MPRAYTNLTEKQDVLKRRIDNINFKINNQLMIVYANRVAGQYFGELALRSNESSKRAATVKTVKDTILAVIDKKNFQNCLERIEYKRNEELVKFYQQISFMRPLSKKVLGDCRLFMEPAKF